VSPLDIDMLGSGEKNTYTPWKPETRARSLMESGCDSSHRFRVIWKTAHYLAEQRGCKEEHAFEDWLKAQREVDALPPPSR